MIPRKPFAELSKSQKNRRLQRTRVDHESVDDGPQLLQSFCFDEQENDNNIINPDIELRDNIVCDENIINFVHSNDSENGVAVEDVNLKINDETRKFDTKIDLGRQIAQWQCQFTISQAASGALLKILSNVESIEELKKLPKDPRTLMGTPKTTVIRSVPPGEYFHYGLKQGLIDQLTAIGASKFPTNIQIHVHIDGLPISKSSKRQLYPILAEVYPKITTPFVIGVYHGLGKPDDCNQFLEEFIDEYKKLKTGFVVDGHHFFVTIRAVICDTPARSYVTYTKGHNGYYGCGKCMQEGDYDKRMRFLEMNAPLRTDTNFIERFNEEHHLGCSKFEEIGVSMVSQFPIEYMHLVCLGVMKKIINWWIKGFRPNKETLMKLSSKQLLQISDLLNTINSWIPSEFVRKTRGLDEIDRWKATELRLFLLYVGPVVLQTYLPDAYLYHFHSLQCAITILCDENNCISNNTCAKNLLYFFVEESKKLYGENFVIYNVHNLLHLADEVLKFGILDSFSAFPFESFLCFIKKILKKGDKPLQQLHKRLEERVKCGYQQVRNENIITPEVSDFNTQKSRKTGIFTYDKINYGNFKLSVRKTSDKFCYVKNHVLVRINNISKQNNDIILHGHKLINPTNFENYPIDSNLLHIVTGNEWSNLISFKASDVLKKAVCIPFKNTFYFFPLIHSFT